MEEKGTRGLAGATGAGSRHASPPWSRACSGTSATPGGTGPGARVGAGTEEAKATPNLKKKSRGGGEEWVSSWQLTEPWNFSPLPPPPPPPPAFHLTWDYEIAEAVEERRQDITGSLEGEGKVPGRVAEIKNPIAHWVVMRNLIRSLEKGPTRRVTSGGSWSPHSSKGGGG